MTEPSSSRAPTWPLAVSLFCSGAAALTYQIVWVRQLTILLGGAWEAVAIVLATFMAGLGLGGLAAGRRVDRWSAGRLRGVYAGIEGAVAAFGLAYPFLLDGLQPVYRLLHGAAEGTLWLVAARAGTAGLLLLVPTTLMGATLPLLTAYHQRGDAGGSPAARSAGVLYGANTFGAMAGSALTAVWLLPALGVRASTFLALLLNGAAIASVLLFARGTRAGARPVVPPSEREVARARGSAPLAPLARAALGVAALSGLAGLVSEIGWSRGLVLLIGPTTYGFAFVVTSVIGGLALGSVVAAGWGERTPAALAAVQLAAALSCFAVSTLVGRLVLPVGRLVHEHADEMGALLALQMAGVAALLLVPSFLLGASFPLAVGLVSSTGVAPGRATGLVYAWNTLGAVAGSLAAGFVVVPLWGAEASLRLASATHAIAAASLVRLGARARTPARAAALATIGALGAAGLWLAPGWDREIVTGGLYKYAPYLEKGEFLDFLRRGDLVFDAEDRIASVTVKRVGPRVSLAIDGKVDATNAEDMLTQRMLAHLPLLLHPEPRTALLVGLGSGVTAASALAHPLERLDVVEISSAVVAAADFFSAVNRGVLDDPRVALHVADGRNHLLMDEARYDVIISEPSNPWMAGVSALFTREFFELARERLSAGGLFCQWAHIYNLSAEEVRIIVAGFVDAFDGAALFLLSESDLLLLGATAAIDVPDAAGLEERMSRPIVRSDLDGVGLASLSNLVSLYTVSTPTLARWVEGAERHTDDRPVLSVRAARSMHASTADDNRRLLEALGRQERAGVTDRWLVLPEAPPSAPEDAARGAMLEGAESYSWAMEHHARALVKDPANESAARGLVRSALGADRVDEARAILEDAGTTASRVALALLARNAMSAADAFRLSMEVLDDAPQDRGALLLASELAGELDRLPDMASLALRWLEIDPLDAEAASLLTEVSLRSGEPARAIEQSRAILESRPDETRALQVFAIASAELGRTEAAGRAFERLLLLEPEVPVHYNNYARMLLDVGELERAARLFERAVDASPRNLPGYEGLEETARRLGDTQRLERARSMLRFLRGSAGAGASTGPGASGAAREAPPPGPPGPAP